MDFHVCQCDLVFIICPLSTGIDVQMVIPETYIYIYISMVYHRIQVFCRNIPRNIGFTTDTNGDYWILTDINDFMGLAIAQNERVLLESRGDEQPSRLWPSR